MKTILASLAAAGVLVAGAFIASTLADAPAGAQVAQESTPETTEPFGPLAEVLDGLVADEILTQPQADEVRERLLSAHTEWRAERRELREERREERAADRELIHGFLEDGVIDSDELALLGDDHPFNDSDGPWADAASDGQITRDELARVGHLWRHYRNGPTDGGAGA